jgi:signal transduction histidine kinase
VIGQVVAFGGWVTASVAVAVALAIWRLLSDRMEAVARACHELRSPLTAARLGLEPGSRRGELSLARLRAVDLELARAALAVDDLARVHERSHRATVIRHEVDVCELLRDSVEAWEATAAEAGVQLAAHWSGSRARVLGDRLRLAQATGNLIANAIEHGGGVVEVRGRVDGASVRVDVTDRGPGLPAPLAELTRCAHRSRGSRGRGLTIAAAIAAGHGGRLGVAPADRGARLVLELPVLRPPLSTAVSGD